jgi:hypothetical protein
VQSPLAARRQAQPTGVIETLSAGYSAVNRQLWVLLLPIVVDVFLWLGPHVSYSPLVGPAVTQASEWTRQIPTGPRRVRGAATPANSQVVISDLDQSRQYLISRADETNGLAALSWGPLALPSVGSSPSTNDDVAFVTGWGDGAALLLACLGVSLLLGGWFYGGLAAASTGARNGPLTAGRFVPRGVLRTLGLVGLLTMGSVLFGLPVVLLIGFTALVSPPVAVLASVLLAAAVLFATVHLFFAVDAIFISHVGPLAAIQRSVSLVRRNLWHSVALIVLTWLILAGMGRVWEVLANSLQSPYGVAVGILGNAYIASGLIAAGMIFYTQRAESPSGAPTRGTT